MSTGYNNTNKEKGLGESLKIEALNTHAFEWKVEKREFYYTGGGNVNYGKLLEY